VAWLRLIAALIPVPNWAYAEPIAGMTALDDTVATADASGLVFVFVPSGSTTPYEVQKRAERWMASRLGEQDGIIEIVFHSERLLWRRGRALCIGTQQCIDEMLAAVTQFTFCEAALRSLEQEAEDVSGTMEQGIHLTDKLSWWTLRRRQSHVDDMTRVATAMQVAHLRLEKALEAPTTEFSAAARRVFIELTLLATTENRLLRLDDAVEAINEHYRFVNGRFADYRYFLREYRFVVLIVVVLLFELAFASERYWRPVLDYLIESVRPWAPWLVGP
jgi:hypothetical protein